MIFSFNYLLLLILTFDRNTMRNFFCNMHNLGPNVLHGTVGWSQKMSRQVNRSHNHNNNNKTIQSNRIEMIETPKR